MDSITSHVNPTPIRPLLLLMFRDRGIAVGCSAHDSILKKGKKGQIRYSMSDTSHTKHKAQVSQIFESMDNVLKRDFEAERGGADSGTCIMHLVASQAHARNKNQPAHTPIMRHLI